MERMEKLYLAVAPGQAAEAGRRGLTPAHLCYRMGEGPHLFRANSPVAPHGGIMVIDDAHVQQGEDGESFCGEVLRECAVRKFTGVFCRFRGKHGPVLSRICARLEELCRGRELECYVTEGFGGSCKARVVIPTALSGGSLRERLGEAVSRFGPGRTAVWLDRAAEDFPLPSPTGSGTPLSREELEQLKSQKGGSVFFSPELCAHYFTYMAGETGHFVLFDDAGSVRKKLRIAREQGIGTAFLPYGEMTDILDEIL